MSNEKRYWASCPLEEIGSEVTAKFEEYQTFIYQANYMDKIRASYQRFYNLDQDGSYRVTKSDDGSITRVTLNHYKNLLKRLHILITQSKLSFLPKSRNSDSKSMIDTDLAKGILEYYGDEKALNYTFSRAVETALVCLESFIHCPWNLNKGHELTADESGKVIHTGDQDFEVFTALDVARNTQTLDSDYYVVRARRNKWDMAALHPEFADVITAEGKPQNNTMDQYRLQVLALDAEADMIDVYYFYHRQTPALPDGRFTVIVNDQVLADGKLGYKRPPVYRLSAGDVVDTIFGDSPGTDLLAIQEVINALATAVVSNNMNHAQQNIWSPDPNLSVKQLAHGQNLVTSSVKPEALQLTASAAETYKLLDSLVAQQQLLSGINDTARGNPESNVKNNGSMALMLAQAVQFVSDLQKSYAQLASDVGTAVIDNMKTFAKGPMLVAIGGLSRKSYIREFQAKDIMNVERVTVDLGDPIAQTTAGRWEMVQGWRQQGTISPRQEVEFLRTGQFDSILEDKFRDAILVRSENEMLRKGEAPVVIMTDDHPYHVIEHNKLLNDPEARYSPELVEAITQHMMEHKIAAQTMDPALQALLAGQMPPPPMPAPMPGAPMPPEQMPVGAQENAQLPPVPEGTPPESAEPYAQLQPQGVPQ
jgi:hypothetical protein